MVQAYVMGKAAEEVFDFKDAKGLIKIALRSRFFSGPSKVLRASYDPNDSRLAVVVGENASGKSFLRRILSAVARKAKQKTEFMHISMQGRTDSGVVRGLIYGREDDDATSVNSVRTVLTGISTSKARDNRHVMFWDEPDIGCSDSTAAAVGRRIAEYAMNPPKELIGAFVVTHNKALARELLKAKPHFIAVGYDSAPETFEDWLSESVQEVDLDALLSKNLETWRKISALLNEK
jgi:energy-coupling factor transporter ATP-binding protein EcfA2